MTTQEIAREERVNKFIETFSLDKVLVTEVFNVYFNRPKGFYHGYEHVLAMGEHFVKNLDGIVLKIPEKNVRRILGYAILFHDFHPYPVKQTSGGTEIMVSAEEASVAVATTYFRDADSRAFDARILSDTLPREEEKRLIYELILSTGKYLNARDYDLSTLFGVINTLDLGYWLFTPYADYNAAVLNESILKEAVYYGFNEDDIIKRRVSFLSQVIYYKSPLIKKIAYLETQMNSNGLLKRFIINTQRAYLDASLTYQKRFKEEMAKSSAKKLYTVELCPKSSATE